jgi:YjbE family integral membrane protein
MPALFTPAWWSALAAIVLIDLVLAGDNAIVIGLAARNVPRELQHRVIVWGTAGAILVRIALTGVVVWLLRIPGFLVAGGFALIWIGWKLTRGGGDAHDVRAVSTVRGAIQTIIVADAVMGVDNVLAVAGAAQGNFVLVMLGLAISIPIVVWGSTLVVRWVDRFPVILWFGAAILGWTAAKMIVGEPLVAPWFGAYPVARIALFALVIVGLVAPPLWRSLSPPQRTQGAVLALLVAWLALFGWIERTMGARLDLFDQWRWDDELIDLVRWTGWIPAAIWLGRRIGEPRR